MIHLTAVLQSAIVAGLSILLAEVVRDSYHALSHAIPALWRWHRLHHQLFSWNYQLASVDAYRRAQWCYDVPEASTMLGVTLLLWVLAHVWQTDYQWGFAVGSLYCAAKVAETIALASGWLAIDHDTVHQPQGDGAPPGRWLVNYAYHWRHHFDHTNAYFSGGISLVDQLLGTGLVLKGKTIAVTGASGTMGQALLHRLYREGSTVVALTSQAQPITLTIDGQPRAIETITWSVGQEAALAERLKTIDILILNHGINLLGARTTEAIFQTYEVNTFSTWRLLELFLTTVQTAQDRATKEVWVNTSEAEVSGAASPLYELSKRSLGSLITLRRLDSPCVIRKLILGDFKSQLNPGGGKLSADWIAARIVDLAKRDVRNIIVTLSPLTFLLVPIKELAETIYFKLFSHAEAPFPLMEEKGGSQS